MNKDKKLQKYVYYVSNGMMPTLNEFNLERKQRHNCDIKNPDRWKRDRSENYNRKNQWLGNGDTKEVLAVYKKYAKKINNHNFKTFETKCKKYNQDFLNGSMQRKCNKIPKNAEYLDPGAQFIDSQKCSRNNSKVKMKKIVDGIGMSELNNVKIQQTLTNENSSRGKTPSHKRFSKYNKHENKNKYRYRKKNCSTPQHLQNCIEEKKMNYSVELIKKAENISLLNQESVTLTAKVNYKSNSKYMRNNKVNYIRSQKCKLEVRNVNTKLPLLNKHPNKEECLNTFPCEVSNLLGPASTIKFVINKYNLNEISPSLAKEEIFCHNKLKNNVMCYFVGLKSNKMQGVCLDWPNKLNEVAKKNKLQDNEQKHESNSITKCLNGGKSNCNTNFHKSPDFRNEKFIKNNIVMVAWTRVRDFFKPGKISRKSLTDNCNEFSLNKLNLNCRCDNTQTDTNAANKKCIKFKKPSYSKLSNLSKCSNPDLSLSVLYTLRNLFRFKKKIVTDEKKLDAPLFEIKIDSITKRVINTSEVKNRLMFLNQHKKEGHAMTQECLKSVGDLKANSKIKGKTILNKISPSPSNCMGPLFELKLDYNDMRILNLPEIERKIRKMSLKYPTKVVDLLDKNLGVENNNTLSGSDSKYLRDIRSKISCLWNRFLCKSENYMSQNKNENQPNRHPFLPKYDNANENIKKTYECRYVTTKLINSGRNTRALDSCKRVNKNNSKSTKVNGKIKHKINHKIITKWFCNKVKSKLINLNKDNKQDGIFNRTTKKEESNNKMKPSKFSKSLNNNDNKISKRKKISKETRTSCYSFKVNDGLKKNKSRRHYQKQKSGRQMFNIFSKASGNASINKNSQSNTYNIYKTCMLKTNTNKKELVSEQRKLTQKKKRKMRRDQISYGCRYAHLKRTKKPCIWLYIVCPSLYPNYLLIISCIRNVAHYMFILVAIVLWSPCIVVFDIFRVCCCFVN